MWPIISTIVLKLKDFLRLQVLRIQAVTYTVKHVQRVHEKRPPPKYNGLVFEILGKHH